MKFSRKQRLCTQADFRFVFSGSRAVRDPYFRILARRNNGDTSRLGMAVSRKTCRKAVERNRLKRIIRESFRQHYEQLVSKGGVDLVVLPTTQAATICNKELAESLDGLWLKVQGATGTAADTNNRNKLNG
jgi:ribonuclease P protein component